MALSFDIIGSIAATALNFTFPKGKSMADIMKSRYGEAFVRIIRKFEKNDYKLPKGYLDLGFSL